MKLFPRKLQKKILPWFERPDTIVILGARQVGKTSLLNLLEADARQLWGDARNILNFNLEDADHLIALNRDPKYFEEYMILSGANPEKDSVVFIDEIQYLDDPSHFLKYLADVVPSVKLIITGSTSIQIKKFKDGMTGRKKNFYLYPLDFREFVLFNEKDMLVSLLEKFSLREILSNQTEIDTQSIVPFVNDLKHLFENYILYGGYPKVVLARSRDEKLHELGELYETYELKDVNVLFNVVNVTAFRNLFKLMAGNVGNLLNINEVAGTLGIGRDTVKRYLAVLEQSFIVHSLPPFHSNVRKELTKMPKLFFLDTGLRNFAIRNFAELSFRPDRGPLFENAVFVELFKNLRIIEQLFFWRTLSKNEVDLVFTGDINIACEVKLSPDTRLRVPAGLKNFGKIYPQFKRIVATMDRFACNQEVTYLPAWMIS